MRNVLLVPLLFLFIGCQGIERLLNGPKDTPPEPVQTISSAPAIGAAPEFNVQTPLGYTRVVFHGELIGTTVNVRADANSLVRVFIKERVLGQWFALNDQYSDAFWYSFNAVGGTVEYHGAHLGLKEFCVYQYVEAQP